MSSNHVKVFISLFALLCILSGCKKVGEKLTRFNIKYEESFTIPKSTPVGIPLSLGSPDIETNAQNEFEAHQTRVELIEGIFLRDLEMTVQSPSGGDFSFVKSAYVYISAEGLEEKEVAWIDDVKNNVGQTLVMNTQGTKLDLREYMVKRTFTLRLHTVTDEILTQDYKVLVKPVFTVDAKILGL